MAEQYSEAMTEPSKGPLSKEMDELSKSIEELDRLVHNLRTHLNSVRRDQDPVQMPTTVEPRDMLEVEGCPLGRQMHEAVQAVRRLSDTVSRLKDELLV